MNARIKLTDAPAERRPGRAMRLISSIRWAEVILWQGTPMFGALFSVGRLTADKVSAMALLLAASLCLVAHVFAINDWSGIEGDLRDPNRAAGVFLTRGIGRGQMALLWAGLMVLGLFLLAPLGIRTLGIGVGIVLLSALYSAPGLDVKGVPVLSSAVNIAGGLLHFLLGYSLFRAVDARGLEIGAFFALVFAAGHLTHEARDWDGDHRNQINTNAVRFGKRWCFFAGLALFTIADGLLLALALGRVVPRSLAAVAVVWLLQTGWSLQALGAGLSFANLRRLQLRYRALYGALGLLMVVTLLPSL